MKTCTRCGSSHETRNLFCPDCGAAFCQDDLKRVKILGAIGVAHSSSPKIEEFWATGDPNVL